MQMNPHNPLQAAAGNNNFMKTEPNELINANGGGVFSSNRFGTSNPISSFTSSSIVSSMDSALGLIESAFSLSAAQQNQLQPQPQPQTQSHASNSNTRASYKKSQNHFNDRDMNVDSADAAHASSARRADSVTVEFAELTGAPSSTTSRDHMTTPSQAVSEVSTAVGVKKFSSSPPAALERLNNSAGAASKGGRGWKKGLSQEQLQAALSANRVFSSASPDSDEPTAVSPVKSMWKFTVRDEKSTAAEPARAELPELTADEINNADSNFLQSLQNRLNFLGSSLRLPQRANSRSHAVKSEVDQLTLDFHRYRGIAHKLLVLSYRIDEFAEQRTVRRAHLLSESDRKSLLSGMLNSPAAVQLASLEIAAEKMRTAEIKRIRSDYLYEQAQLQSESIEAEKNSAAARKSEADSREIAEERADRNGEVGENGEAPTNSNGKKKNRKSSRKAASEESSSEDESKKSAFKQLSRSLPSSGRFDSSVIEDVVSRGSSIGLSAAEVHEFLLLHFTKDESAGKSRALANQLKSLKTWVPSHQTNSRTRNKNQEAELQEEEEEEREREKDKVVRREEKLKKRFSSRFQCTCKRLDPSNDERDPQPKIQCDRCDLWFHFKCVGITSEMEKKFEKLTHFNWFCPGCELWHCRCKLLDPYNPNDRTKQIRCSACKIWFHFRCIDLDPDGAIKLFEAGNSWFCIDCNKKGGILAPKREEARAPNTKYNPKFDQDCEDFPVDKRPTDILFDLKARRRGPDEFMTALLNSQSETARKRKSLQIEEIVDEKANNKKMAKELAQLEDWSWDSKRKHKKPADSKDSQQLTATNTSSNSNSTELIPASSNPAPQSSAESLSTKVALPLRQKTPIYSNNQIRDTAPFNKRARSHCMCWNLDPDDHFDRTQQIACSNCRVWFHFRCVNLSNFDPQRFKDSGVCVWYCPRCRDSDMEKLNKVASKIMRDVGKVKNDRYKFSFATPAPTSPTPPPEGSATMIIPRTRYHCECLNLDSDNPDQDQTPQIQCNHCKIWFHLKCVNERVDFVMKLRSWFCRYCRVGNERQFCNFIWNRWCAGFRPNEPTALPGETSNALIPIIPTGRRFHCYCFQLDPDQPIQPTDEKTVTCGNCKVLFHHSCSHYKSEMVHVTPGQLWYCTRCREPKVHPIRLDTKRLYMRDCGFIANKPGEPPGSNLRPKGVPETVSDGSLLPEQFFHCFCFQIALHDPKDTAPQILCNNCKVWYHLSCTNHTRQDVDHFMSSSERGWFCPRCRHRGDPLTLDLTALDIKDVGKNPNLFGELSCVRQRVGRAPAYPPRRKYNKSKKPKLPTLMPSTDGQTPNPTHSNQNQAAAGTVESAIKDDAAVPIDSSSIPISSIPPPVTFIEILDDTPVSSSPIPISQPPISHSNNQTAQLHQHQHQPQFLDKSIDLFRDAEAGAEADQEQDQEIPESDSVMEM